MLPRTHCCQACTYGSEAVVEGMELLNGIDELVGCSVGDAPSLHNIFRANSFVSKMAGFRR